MLPSQDLLTQEIFHQHQVVGRYWAFISAMANTSGGINVGFGRQSYAKFCENAKFGVGDLFLGRKMESWWA
ncbi:MAG: hypothetical protein JNM36_09600 [Chitinophagales bacterium]|nr:hypothetical protein [Chitinophagales bacterium]